VLIDAFDEIAGNTNVERTVFPARKNVDTRPFHFLKLTNIQTYINKSPSPRKRRPGHSLIIYKTGFPLARE
jgi:hypothetical protein